MSSVISDILKIKLNPGAMRNKTKITYLYSTSIWFLHVDLFPYLSDKVKISYIGNTVK